LFTSEILAANDLTTSRFLEELTGRSETVEMFVTLVSAIISVAMGS